MLAETAHLGQLVEYAGTAAIWAAVLLRIPSARHDRRRRGLCIAVAAAAAAMALRLGPVGRAIGFFTHDPNLTQLAMHLFGAFSAILVLDFVLVVTGGGPPRARLHIVGATLLLALVLLGATAKPPTLALIGPHGVSVPSIGFWCTLIGMHLAADGTCLIVCWRYSRRSTSGSSRTSLALFGLGTAFAGLFWIGYLIYLPTRSAWIPPLLSLTMGLHGMLRAASIVVPTALDTRRVLDNTTTLWRLWPLWRALVDAVPSVALARPRNRLRETLWPQGPRELLIYRKIVEIRDAILVLCDYLPSKHAFATGGTDSAGTRGEDPDALADLLREACRAKLAGEPPSVDRSALAQPDFADMAGETEFLLRVAAAYRCPAA
ncbi:MAB_1171c family putative transporter [Kitasatospora sp. NPDC096077]|uniref:MAB_1171c family putative transporter n=1 Tax=Kitasatospora sp. NPDC096077 TaxID=3155544 RepID=UPI00331F8068